MRNILIIMYSVLLTSCITIVVEPPEVPAKIRLPDVISQRPELSEYYLWDFECDCWVWGEDGKKKVRGKVIFGTPDIEWLPEKVKSNN